MDDWLLLHAWRELRSPRRGVSLGEVEQGSSGNAPVHQRVKEGPGELRHRRKGA